MNWMPPATHAQQLLSLLARTSFKLGQFKLSSGGTSDYYIDCRTTTLHAEGGRLTGHAILELLEKNNIDAEAVGGLTMGADPIVSKIQRRIVEIVVMFLEFIQFSLQNVMGKVDLETLKAHDARIALMMHAQALAQQQG